MPLPQFTYHPHPLETGSVKTSDAECACCGQKRGYIYTGPVYGEGKLRNALCPWCIEDGTAHEKFGATFTFLDGIGDYGDDQPVPNCVVEEVAFRTPGFTGWQQASWVTHCGDAAIFLGSAGHEELLAYGEPLIQKLKTMSRAEGERWDQVFRSFHKNQGAALVLVFRCRKCQELECYIDLM